MAGTNALDETTYRENLATILRAITPSIGQVEPRRGANPDWAPDHTNQKAFTEIHCGPTQEIGHSIGPAARELLTLIMDVFLPLSYADKSEDRLDGITKQIRDTLRANPTLKVGGVPTATSSLAAGARTAMPQVTANDLVWLETGVVGLGAVRCHHRRIEFSVDRIFSYTAT